MLLCSENVISDFSFLLSLKLSSIFFKNFQTFKNGGFRLKLEVPPNSMLKRLQDVMNSLQGSHCVPHSYFQA